MKSKVSSEERTGDINNTNSGLVRQEGKLRTLHDYTEQAHRAE